MILNQPPNHPPRLKKKIEAVKEEEDAYAADELVELGEEILSQLAAIGIAVYLQQARQKEVFNDFLISLFLSNGHAYNAGPLFRWAANMIKDADGEDAKLLKPFFWQKKKGAEVLNEEIHHLAGLRNAVMHGFFVLPPERNREEAKKMELILEKITKAGLFDKTNGNFHFLDEHGFNGHWNISDPQDWKHFERCHAFGDLSARVSHEYADSFLREEHDFAFQESDVITDIGPSVEVLLRKEKGALVCWYTPGSNRGQKSYRTIIKEVIERNYEPVYYALHDQGATFTSSFLLQQLGRTLVAITQNEKAGKDPLKFLKNQNNRKHLNKIPVIVLHDIHIGLFNDNHLTLLFNDLYDAEVPVLCTSWHYPYLHRFFNQSIIVADESILTDEKLMDYSLANYLRFKGPSKEQNDQVAEYQKLAEIVQKIQKALKKEKVIARRFADDNNYPIEYVHEAFSILSPFYKTEKEPFVQDEVDELYGFPKTIEESSRIFLSLGRRDVKLEYQHRVLTKN